MSEERELLYYKLTPVYEPPVGTLQSASLQHCLATGEVLAGMGGGGLALSKDVVRALDMANNDSQPMVVCKAALFDALVECLKGVRELIGNVEGCEPFIAAAPTIDGVLAWVEREEDDA